MENQNKLYYLSLKGNRQGPFTFLQLQNMYITPKTMVWVAGESGWRMAGQLEELRPLFYTEVHYDQSFIPVKTWLVEAILVTLFCCLPFGIIAIVYSIKAQSMNTQRRRSYAQRYSYAAKNWVLGGFFTGLVLGHLTFGCYYLFGVFLLAGVFS
ncbi:MAG: CD225/dispanin family protein [Bacteroides sp.]|nr:CD225/dispanin family protein [Bacteroides sp.]